LWYTFNKENQIIVGIGSLLITLIIVYLLIYIESLKEDMAANKYNIRVIFHQDSRGVYIQFYGDGHYYIYGQKYFDMYYTVGADK
jgi:hypothetical protein